MTNCRYNDPNRNATWHVDERRIVHVKYDLRVAPMIEDGMAGELIEDAGDVFPAENQIGRACRNCQWRCPTLSHLALESRQRTA